jgi:hypothetical protein
MRMPITEECFARITEKESRTTVKRKIISMYLQGYNVMHIRPKNERFLPSQRDAVREVVSRNLMGAEIIEDSSQLITVAYSNVNAQRCDYCNVYW